MKAIAAHQPKLHSRWWLNTLYQSTRLRALNLFSESDLARFLTHYFPWTKS